MLNEFFKIKLANNYRLLKLKFISKISKNLKTQNEK